MKSYTQDETLQHKVRDETAPKRLAAGGPDHARMLGSGPPVGSSEADGPTVSASSAESGPAHPCPNSLLYYRSASRSSPAAAAALGQILIQIQICSLATLSDEPPAAATAAMAIDGEDFFVGIAQLFAGDAASDCDSATPCAGDDLDSKDDLAEYYIAYAKPAEVVELNDDSKPLIDLNAERKPLIDLNAERKPLINLNADRKLLIDLNAYDEQVSGWNSETWTSLRKQQGDAQAKKAETAASKKGLGYFCYGSHGAYKPPMN